MGSHVLKVRDSKVCMNQVDNIDPKKEADGHYEEFTRFFTLYRQAFRFYCFSRNADGLLTYVSPKVTEILGYEPEDFQKNWKQYLTGHQTNQQIVQRSEQPEYGVDHLEPYNVEIKTKQGNQVWLDVHEVPITDHQGEVIKYHGVAIDYTARKNLESKIRSQEKHFREISQVAPIAIFHADANDLLTYVNPAWQTITGWKLRETLGNTWWQIIHPDDKEKVRSSWTKKVSEVREISIECRVIHPGGKTVWVQLRSRFLFDDSGKIVFGTLENISELKAAQEEQERLRAELLDLQKKLEISTGTDSLRNLPNSREWSKKLDDEKTRFDDSQKPFSILICNIDYFKNINDYFGQDAGDYILHQIARLLEDSSRKQDLVSRWGGGGFIIMVPETDLENAAHLAEKLRTKIEKEKFVYGDRVVFVTTSFGLSVYSDRAATVEDVAKEADRYLLEAKSTGRNRVVYKKVPDPVSP